MCLYLNTKNPRKNLGLIFGVSEWTGLEPVWLENKNNLFNFKLYKKTNQATRFTILNLNLRKKITTDH